MVKPLFDGTIPTTTTKYIPVPIHDGLIGLDISWVDATTAAAITLEFTSHDSTSAPVDVAGTYEWKASGVAITGPAGGSVGGSLVNVENVRQRRARLKIVTTAASNFKICDGVGAPRS